MENNTLMSHEIVMASSDKVTNKFISKMKKEEPINFPFLHCFLFVQGQFC